MIVRTQGFQVKTTPGTFEVDDFDWGHPDKYGAQYLTFFRDGEVVYQLPIEEVHEIIQTSFLKEVNRKRRTESQSAPKDVPVMTVVAG